MRQVGTDDALVSNPGSVPIENLRNGYVLNRNSVPDSAAGVVVHWTGTRSGAEDIFTSCSVDAASYPNIFWACGNVGGIHLTGGTSSWDSNTANNVPLQLWLR